MNRLIFSFFLFSSSLFSNIFPFQTIEKANIAYKNGEFIKSARLFNCLDSKNAYIYYNMANAYYKAKMYKMALDNYKKAKGIDDAIRLYNIGNSYFKKEKFNKAIEFYVKSLNLKEDIDTQHNLLLAEERLKDIDQSLIKSKQNNFNKKKITKEQIHKDNLTYLLQQINKKNISTIMYNFNIDKKEDSEKNPW